LRAPLRQAAARGLIDAEAEQEEDDEGAVGMGVIGGGQMLLGKDGKLVNVSSSAGCLGWLPTCMSVAHPPPATHHTLV